MLPYYDSLKRLVPGNGAAEGRPLLARLTGCGPIGIELGHQELHLVQIEREREGGLVLRAAAALTYPNGREAMLADPLALRRLLRDARARQPLSGRRVVSCLPADRVRLSLVSYAAGAEEEREIAALATSSVDGDPADWVIDYVPVVPRGGQASEERTALVARALREDVLDHCTLLERAGLEVEAVEIGPVAIQRLVARVAEPAGESVVLAINFGYERSFLTVFVDGAMTHEREMAFGEAGLVTRVATQLDLADEEARGLLYGHGLRGAKSGQLGSVLVEILRPRLAELVDHVERVVVYTASQLRGAGVDTIYLLGSLARWPGIEDTLGELLSLPVRALDPLASFSAHRKLGIRIDPAAALALAAGCALRGIDDA